MALVPRSGSLTSTSSHTPGEPTPATRTDALDHLDVVRDATVERTAFNTETYPVDRALIQGYLDGSRIQVTYYHREVSNAGYRGGSIDNSTMRNTIHDPVVKIRDFELTVTDDFTMSYDADTTGTEFIGTALTYAGFNPHLGDEFLYDSGTGRVLVLQLTQVEPLSIHSEDTHRITVQALGILTSEHHTLLESRVTKTLQFDKSLYFMGQKTLLTHDRYTQYNTFQKMRTVLLQHYYRLYFNKDQRTVFLPSGIYDPYLVEFLLHITSFQEVPIRPRQLVSRPISYDHSVWFRLHEQASLRVDDLAYHVEHIYHDRWTSQTPSLTSLINRYYLLLRPTPSTVSLVDTPYVFSEAFYTGDTTLMSVFEQMVYTYITTRTVNSDILMGYMSTYPDLDQGHYQIPILIRLIDGIMTQYTRSHRI